MITEVPMVHQCCSRSREDTSDGVPGTLTEPFWKLYLILDYKVTSAIRPFGVWQPFATYSPPHTWLHNVRCHTDRFALQGGNIDCTAAQGLKGKHQKTNQEKKKSSFIHQNELCWMLVCGSYLGSFAFTLKMLRDLYLHLGVRSLLDKRCQNHHV